MTERVDALLGKGEGERIAVSTLVHNVLDWALKCIPDPIFRNFSLDARRVWDVYRCNTGQDLGSSPEYNKPVINNPLPVSFWENLNKNNLHNFPGENK
jgi:hypothetical protein